MVRAFNSLSISPTHTLTGRGGGGCQGQVPLHSLTNIKSVKSEDGDSTLSTGIYGTGTYVCVLE